MLRSLISASALALMSSAAFAADLPIFEPTPVMTSPVPMASNWTGFYVGAQAGWAFGGDGGEGIFEDDDEDDLFEGDDFGGFTVGAKVGYDVQVNRFVVGLVADVNYLDFDSDIDFDDEDTDAAMSLSESIDWYASLRGRAGFLVTDTVLLYGVGGLAYASTDSEGTFIDEDGTEGEFGDDDDSWGWTLGAGVEAAVTQNLRVGLEYAYFDFGDGEDEDDDSESFDFDSADFDFHTVRASVSYKF